MQVEIALNHYQIIIALLSLLIWSMIVAGSYYRKGVKDSKNNNS